MMVCSLFKPTQHRQNFYMNAITSTQFTQAGQITFAYREIGKGYPLVLFQRFWGTMDDWDPAFIDKLAQQKRVLIFDNVGFGLTSGKTPQTILGMVHDAKRFTEIIGLEKFNILGWSLGGIVAQVFTFTYPALINKLVLVGTGPGSSTETFYPQEKFLKVAHKEENTPEDHQILFFSETEEGRIETLKSLERIKQRAVYPIPPTKKENWKMQALAMRDFFGSPQYYFARLKEIKHPVLIGGAKQDLAFPLVDSYLLAREIPNSQLVTYSNAGHGFHHQHYEHFGNIVNDFLK